MRALDSAVKEAEIAVLTEVGVDPGVDHLYAAKMIEMHSKGGKVKEFHSFCGGVPAPEHSDNPLRFKFSWSPRGARNSATFLRDNKIVSTAADDVMASAEPYYVADGFLFVAYPNRNSVPFREYYDIPEAQTVVRGSLRYVGNPTFVKALADLGWLDEGIQQRAIDAVRADEGSVVAAIEKTCKFSSLEERNCIITGLNEIGLLSSEPATISYQPDEGDLVMLQHKFVVEWKNGNTHIITSTLELYGEPNGYSAMANSVGVTCGVASQMLLDGQKGFDVPGVLAPYSKAICEPIRERVENGGGFKMIEKTLWSTREPR
ncbi:MAG: hypothetical protein M1836_005477 [Candelina mexicana]|nr:MAG: hypothetical protein M1836_005477 [Candelina mexicana]